MELDYRTFSEIGKRADNEDRVFAGSIAQEASLFLVVDGMGGYSNGALAAQTVGNVVFDEIEKGFSSFDDKKVLIHTAITVSNGCIAEITKKNGTPMGATLAGVLMMPSASIAFWVGDVRIYHIRNGEIIFQSKDHSIINKLKSKGQTVSSQTVQRMGHLLERAIEGDDDICKPDYTVFTGLQPKDAVMLFSDGVHNVVGPTETAVKWTESLSLDDFVQRVCSTCYKYGSDNYSGVVIALR